MHMPWKRSSLNVCRMMDINRLADIIIFRLHSEGIHILRYDAYSTNSIYLKLDYGVCNSIRISDHKGKKHLKYRYNIGTDINNKHTTDDGYQRYFYPADRYEDLLKDIIDDRNWKIKKYGNEGYRSYMRDNIATKADTRGFWQEARIVHVVDGMIKYEKFKYEKENMNMTTNNGPIVVTTGKVRLSYAHLTEPTAIEEGQEKKYSASFIIPKTDKKTLEKIATAIKAATGRGIESKWGGKKPANLKLPLRDGDAERSEDEAYKSAYFINANCKSRPFAVDEKKHEYPSLELIEENLYSGCYVYANVSFYPFNAAGNKGVACGLNGVMKAADGEPLSSRVSADVAFAEIEVEDTAGDQGFDSIDDLLG